MQQAILTVDLGFGDSGKGSMVDYFTRRYDAHTVVRYNGGAQAGHRVVLPPGDRARLGLDETEGSHIFAQFGSGTLAGARTHLSRFMLLEPLAMMAEAEHLATLGVTDAFARTTIDQHALVITPFQRAVNRLRELARGPNRHGSCGMGIGETMADALAHKRNVLYAGDLANVDRLYQKLSFLRTLNLAKVEALRSALPDCPQTALELELLTDPSWADWLVEAYGDFCKGATIVPGEALDDILRRPGTVVFEGAQGVLLDEWRGFHPYTTWSTTTLANADTLLAEVGYAGRVERIGITRAYATRHGAGPLVTEDEALTALLPDAANHHGVWQQGFRVGWLDLVMLRYAREVVGRLDGLAVTCLDRLAALPEIRACTHYQMAGNCIADLMVSPHGKELEYQSVLTRQLLCASPCLRPIENVQELLAVVGQNVGVPVRYGSSAADACGKSKI